MPLHISRILHTKPNLAPSVSLPSTMFSLPLHPHIFVVQPTRLRIEAGVAPYVWANARVM